MQLDGLPNLGKQSNLKQSRGVLNSSFTESSCPCEESYPFEDGDEVDTSEMHNLIDQLGSAKVNCLVTEYVQGDDNLPVRFEVDNEQWEEQFFSSQN